MADEAEDVNVQVETETTATESSTEETNDQEVVSELEENSSTKETEDKMGGEDAAENQQPNDTSKKNAETRKQQLNNEIRDKVAERNALRREIAELNRQKYELKTPDDIPTVEALMEQQNPETGDYYTRTEARLARMEAEHELELAERRLSEYTERIVDERLRLKEEASRALKDFPMFDEESELYNEELAKQANQVADNLIITDQNTGEIIGSRGSIYDVYALVASAAKSAEMSGKIAGRKAAVNMMNQADVIGASGAAMSSDDENDPFLKGFDRANY